MRFWDRPGLIENERKEQWRNDRWSDSIIFNKRKKTYGRIIKGNMQINYELVFYAE